ncbi:hypothetical protein [Aeromonas media]|uniref:hypothetical protein n=1 Tax=Aeromonas media TaxID=651 RepID=UPI00111BB87A|nr:hypothetical protein [Aeromonas media]
MPAKQYELQCDKLGYIDKYIPNLIFILFVFQQFGITYHLSAASFGLGLLAYLVRNEFTMSALRESVVISVAITISFVAVIFKYGYSENLLRLFPTLICAMLLVLIFRKNTAIPAPNSRLVLITLFFICIVALYQLFIDRSLQVPDSLLAKGEGSNISLAADDSIYDYYTYMLRANSIYTEPSYFGMVLCSLYVLVLKSNQKLKFFVITMIIITLMLSGSVLGIIGVMLLTSVLFNNRFNVFVFIFIFFLLFFLLFATTGFQWISDSIMGYDLSFVDRLSNIGDDGSFVVRLLNPIYLISENINNVDLFGVPSDFYHHYLYTGLYSSLGDFPGHNGILSLILHYGLAGVLVIFFVLRQLNSPLELIVLIIVASQNGSFLTYDKVLSIMFVIFSIRKQTDLTVNE